MTVTQDAGIFTILSNLSAAAVLAWAAIWWFTRGRSTGTPGTGAIAVALACVTTYMVVTGLVYNTLLRTVELPQGSEPVWWSNEVLHLVGPLFLLRKRLAVSRWGTLAAKWAIMLIIAAVQAGLFLAVCGLVGTSLPNAFVLWAFSVLAIFAVGVSAGAVMAVFGNPGLLINLVFFVILGLPSSGGTDRKSVV